MTYTHTTIPYPADKPMQCDRCGRDHQAGDLVRRQVIDDGGPEFEVKQLCADECEAPLLVVSADEIELSRIAAELKECRHGKEVLETRFAQLEADYKQARTDRDDLQIKLRRCQDELTHGRMKVGQLEKEKQEALQDVETWLNGCVRLENQMDDLMSEMKELQQANEQLRADLLNQAEGVLERQAAFNKSNESTMLATMRRELDAAYAEVRALDEERRLLQRQRDALIETIESQALADAKQKTTPITVTLNPVMLGNAEAVKKAVAQMGRAWSKPQESKPIRTDLGRGWYDMAVIEVTPKAPKPIKLIVTEGHQDRIDDQAKIDMTVNATLDLICDLRQAIRTVGGKLEEDEGNEQLEELAARYNDIKTERDELKAQMGPSERIFLNPPADLRGLTREQFFARLVTERGELKAELKQLRAEWGELGRQLHDLQQAKQPVMAKMEDVQDWLKPLADDLKRVEQERDDAHQYIRHVANWMLDRLNAIENGESMRDIASALDAKSWEMLGFGEDEFEYKRFQDADRVKALEADLNEAQQDIARLNAYFENADLQRSALERQARARLVREIEFVRAVERRANDIPNDSNPTRRATSLARLAATQLEVIEQDKTIEHPAEARVKELEAELAEIMADLKAARKEVGELRYQLGILPPRDAQGSEHDKVAAYFNREQVSAPDPDEVDMSPIEVHYPRLSSKDWITVSATHNKRVQVIVSNGAPGGSQAHAHSRTIQLPPELADKLITQIAKAIADIKR